MPNTAIAYTKSNTSLIQQYSHLVPRIVRKLAQRFPDHEDQDDMRQYGYLGLIQAVERYNPKQMASFEHYAIMRIQGSILDAKRKSDWVPRSTRSRAKEIVYIRSELKKRLLRTPDVEEVAAAMGMSIKSYLRIEGKLDTRCLLSLDNGRDEDRALIDAVPSSQPNPEQHLEQKRQIASLRNAREALSDREKEILVWYYEDGKTFKEIAQVLGLTESRISQIHSKICTQLRKKL